MFALPDGFALLEASLDDGGWQARLRVEDDHPALDGHFQGNPILPGIAQVGLAVHGASQAAGSAVVVTAIPSVRFRKVVRPGEVLELRVERPDPGGTVRFELRSAGALACSGSLTTGSP